MRAYLKIMRVPNSLGLDPFGESFSSMPREQHLSSFHWYHPKSSPWIRQKVSLSPIKENGGHFQEQWLFKTLICWRWINRRLTLTEYSPILSNRKNGANAKLHFFVWSWSIHIIVKLSHPASLVCSSVS